MNNFQCLPSLQIDPLLLAQIAQSLSNPDDSLQDSFIPQFPTSKPKRAKTPSWSKFHLKWFPKGLKYTTGVIMEDYLVVLAQDKSLHRNEPEYRKDYDSTGDEPACLLAFNLINHSVQRAEINVSLFENQKGYSLLKYGKNQIIKFGGSSNYASCLACITIESFERILLIFLKEILKRNKAFKVKCEEIPDNNQTPNFSSEHTAQIYKDFLIFYGKVKKFGGFGYQRAVVDELWWFDLKERTWKLHGTVGEAPRLENAAKGFIFQDNLYVYRVIEGKSDRTELFMLNFYTMKWTKIPQENEYLQAEDDMGFQNCGGIVYKDHLITLQRPPSFNKNVLCLLNLQTKNTWTTFNIKGINKSLRMSKVPTGDLMIYKNMLLCLTTAGYDQNLVVAILNIQNFEICAFEKELESSWWFMSQNGSDVAFKIEGSIIPAHKQVLMKKSRYFEKVFNSGMAESKQKIIEITDCEYDIFKEYLRWIYQGTVKFSHEDQAIKLHILADKYLQEDLCKKCQEFLVSIIDMDNVYTILGFAHQENILHVKNWCFKCIKDKLNIYNVVGFISFLDYHQEFKENNKEFRDQAFLFVLDNFFVIYMNANIQIYEDFVMRNIGMETLPSLALFLSGDFRTQRDFFEEIYEEKPQGEGEEIYSEESDSEDEVQSRKAPTLSQELFDQSTANIRGAVFGFMQENTRFIMTCGMAEVFPHGFLKDFILYTDESLNNLKVEVQALKSENRKRMEPSQNEGFDGEGDRHELKKTKKFDTGYGN